MNETIRETRIAAMEKKSVNLSRNHQCRFKMGSTAYTKPLFCLVKCTILALPWSLTEHLDAVLDERLDGLTVWWCCNCNHVLPGLKGDELQRSYFDSVVIGRVFFPS